MLIPARRLLLAAALWLILGIAVAFWPALLDWWRALGMTLLGLSLIDALAGRRRRGRLTVRRELAHIMPVGTWQTIALRLSRVDGRAFDGASGWLADGHPPAFRSEGLPLRFKVETDRWQRVAYRLSISERGRQIFDRVTLRCVSPLRLWLVQESIGARDEVRVFPNFARVAHYTLLATDNRLSQLGILQRRRRGEGMEFHQLRDYRQDDAPRLIDWKASSRVGRLITREHQDERGGELQPARQGRGDQARALGQPGAQNQRRAARVAPGGDALVGG
ncbi:MAG TPA: DUF58 domain-containing protein, partial [Accumulibacter sp.]|nr:DUF58 domain-containing protein [Accumulibacter sp.]